MARVTVAANSTWNLQNFRGGLIRDLVRAGHEVITISPDQHGPSLVGLTLAHRKCGMARSGLNPVQDAAYCAGLFRVLRRDKPDIFLGFTIKPNIYGCIACRILRIRAMPNVSGLGTAFLGRSSLRRMVLLLYRLAFRWAEPVFFQNGDDERLFRAERVVRDGQGRVIPGSGVNLRQFPCSNPPERLGFLMIARLIADKGVREYVAAARIIKSKIPTATFSLLGELDRQNRTAVAEEELDSWQREGVINYLGSAGDVRPFIRQNAVIVLPSYREGLPRTLLEGAAMGRPLIGTDVPGCREVVREGATGFLCQPRDPDSLASAMERFARAPYAERARMGANARAMAEKEFDEALVIETYLDAIRRASVEGHA